MADVHDKTTRSYKNTRSEMLVRRFFYAYSLRKLPNLARLVKLCVVPDIMAVPRGLSHIGLANLQAVLAASKSDESIIVH